MHHVEQLLITFAIDAKHLCLQSTQNCDNEKMVSDARETSAMLHQGEIPNQIY